MKPEDKTAGGGPIERPPPGDSINYKVVVMKDIAPTMGEIAAVADWLWIQAGKPAGRDLEFWIQAENMAVGRYLSEIAILGAAAGIRSSRRRGSRASLLCP